ncbi:hypothetical protein A8990_10172 [Paenibacillus taihuensis]|uniref:Uncharacterized protein n=1 Tax=Paenibacillus taihuensis TaxID=1156355 RepID=A0A3D9SRE9_9BACL|nr:hypothetical protein [Paenibacillus taihuensis]REE94281.1 hypothetical protein A8990_10172 [Paenibacillus taihuensis]
MDKRKVITAYKRGFITVHECAQILGIDTSQMKGLMNDPNLNVDPHLLRSQHSANG